MNSLAGMRRNEIRTAWLMAFPGLALLTVFLITPFVMAFVLSLTNQRLVPIIARPTRFIGVRNYLRLFADDVFWAAIRNNFVFAIVVVPVQSSVALLLAMLINRRAPGIDIFRTVYFMPVVMNMVVVAIVWSVFFNPSQGLFNAAIGAIVGPSFEPIGWLNDPATALLSIIILSVWKSVGFQMIVFLAGLQEIPAELYEASAIDGASPWMAFIRITIPSLRNTIIFIVVSTTILAFQLFSQVQILTQGGPQRATMTAVVLMYREGFSQQRIGYASSIAVVFFLIVLLVSVVQRTFLREERQV